MPVRVRAIAHISRNCVYVHNIHQLLDPVEIIQVNGHQCRETLTDEQVKATDWSTKVSYLNRNSVTVVTQVILWGKSIMG